MVAHGKGLAKIAKTLNAEHIARWSPKASAAAPPLLDALGREEARKQVVMAEIATLKAQRPLDLEPAAVETVKHTLQERAGDVRTLLGRQPVQARQAIRKLLVGKLSFVPLECDGVPVGYRFTGQATLGRLLTGETAAASRVGGPNGIRTRVSVTTTFSPIRSVSCKAT
jgi:hypothetical protein